METKKTKKNTKEKAVKSDVKTHPMIKGTRITEKAAIGAERGAYTFNVMPNASKSEVKKAIKMIYGVTPVKIAMTKITSKVVFRRGMVGTKQGGKKAVVYLKKGDKIAFA